MNDVRREVERVVHDVLIDIGVSESEMKPDAELLGIMADEDATFWFVPHVERGLNVKVPIEDWESVITIAETVEMLERRLSIARRL
jgi:hypothetical protein